jgi:hypothetical protein
MISGCSDAVLVVIPGRYAEWKRCSMGTCAIPGNCRYGQLLLCGYIGAQCKFPHEQGTMRHYRR